MAVLDLQPLEVSREFCRLIRFAGCDFVGLSIETACARLLANMNRGYLKKNIRSALEHLAESSVDHGISLVIGGPGETMASIRETFNLVDSYTGIKVVWVNIGVFGLKRHLSALAPESGRAGNRASASGLFQDAWYISPELDTDEMGNFMDTLEERKNCLVQIKTYPGPDIPGDHRRQLRPPLQWRRVLSTLK